MLGSHIKLLARVCILSFCVVPAAFAADDTASRGLAQQPEAGLTEGWRLVRTPNPTPGGGPDAVSIMHTADPAKSDLDLAGLMIRCKGPSTEIAIVTLHAFTLRARPHVVLGNPGHEVSFDATIGAPGTVVVLPIDGRALANGDSYGEGDLRVRIEDDDAKIAGVVALGGLRSAFEKLITNCASQ